MRICVICRSVGTVVVGGVETYVRETYSRIAEKEDVTVITGEYGPQPQPFRDFKRKVKCRMYPFISRHMRLSRIFHRFHIYDDEMEALSLVPFVFFHLLGNRYDLVVVNNPIFVPIVKLLRMRCTFINHGSIGRRRYFFLRTFRPDLAISCSQFIRKDLLDKFGIDSEVVYHGVNLDEFDIKLSESEKERIRGELFPDSPFENIYRSQFKNPGDAP